MFNIWAVKFWALVSALVGCLVVGEVAAGAAPGERTIKFETNESTWMDVDVSPDEQAIIFNLLGDIYKVGIAGGQAQRLTSGPAYDYDAHILPRW